MYPDKFYSFKNGVKLTNKEINEWLEGFRIQLLSSEVGFNTFRSSGDTMVTCHNFEDEYYFTVASSDGYSDFSVFKGEEDLSAMSFTSDTSSTPRLENWGIFDSYGGSILAGEVYNDSRFKDGSYIKTSHLVEINEDYTIAQTNNTTYTLGKRIN